MRAWQRGRGSEGVTGRRQGGYGSDGAAVGVKSWQ